MPRYYFHLQSPEDRLKDEEGVVLPDIEAAWYQAVRSARELIRNEERIGFSFDQQMIEIADDRGWPLERVPLSDIARYAM